MSPSVIFLGNLEEDYGYTVCAFLSIIKVNDF
jgi:hypothetical protein